MMMEPLASVNIEVGDVSTVLANLARPKTSATITVRVIKSFEFRTEKSLVLHNVNLESTTVADLRAMAHQAIKTQPGWKAYRSLVHSNDESQRLDTLKLYTRAHGAKTTNLIINLDHDDWILDDCDKTLSQVGFENETEVSLFNRQAYEAFKAHPETRWDGFAFYQKTDPKTFPPSDKPNHGLVPQTNMLLGEPEPRIFSTNSDPKVN